jgi:hypothetical protein
MMIIIEELKQVHLKNVNQFHQMKIIANLIHNVYKILIHLINVLQLLLRQNMDHLHVELMLNLHQMKIQMIVTNVQILI